MFLHLGNGISVREEEILGIYDYNLFRSGENRRYLTERQSRMIYPEDREQPVKAVVVTSDAIYFSCIAPVTLYRRAGLFTRLGRKLRQ